MSGSSASRQPGETPTVGVRFRRRAIASSCTSRSQLVAFERGRRHCAAPVLAVTVSSLRWSFSDRRRPQSGFSTTNARYALRRITPSRARVVVLTRNQEVDARQSLRFCNARQWNNDCDADVVEQSRCRGSANSCCQIAVWLL